MTIEELARVAGTVEAWCGGPLSEHLTQGELQGICSKIIPLIAAELAGVAREHHEHGDEWYRHNKMATVGQTIALAILNHARKMGEA